MVPNVLSKISEKTSSDTHYKTPGQVDYEADLQRRPTYHDGTPRKQWHELDAISRWSWERGAQQSR